MEYSKHLYLILYPNQALVCSQLGPEDFSKHYQLGSTRHYSGKLIFAEIDVDYRHDYFGIESALKQLVPHEDGRPKATKFICSYRTLEHIDISAIQKLHLAASNGAVLSIDPSDAGDTPGEHPPISVMAEITPISMIVLTKMDPDAFGHYMTDPQNPKGAPSLFYSCLDLDIDGFLQEFEENPFMEAPFNFIHPSKMRDAIVEVRDLPDKKVKGLRLNTPLGSISYRSISRGFWFHDSNGVMRFFEMPDMHNIESENYKFYRGL